MDTNFWFALSVRSRHEKSVQQLLDYKGYATALPVVKYQHTRRSGTRWDNDIPLIPGYVFVGPDLSNPFHFVTTPGVVRMVSFGGEAAAIPSSEIEALERVAASHLPIGHCSYTRVGECVRLVRGPLTGLRGIVSRNAGTTRLVVSVTMLQRSVSVEIDNEWAVPD